MSFRFVAVRCAAAALSRGPGIEKKVAPWTAFSSAPAQAGK
jgi:hypothetical protein